MISRLIVVTLACTACWTNAGEPRATKVEPVVRSTPVHEEPVTLDLVEGVESSLPDGTKVGVKGVMYAHLADSKNLSSCTVIVTRGDATIEVALSRLHGDPTVPVSARGGLGWSFTLESADPYQQPSRARVVAQKP